MSLFTAEQLAASAGITIPRAREQLAAHKAAFMSGHVGKQTRPWFVVDFPALHPNDATLVGFEIETGFRTADARRNFLEWLWDNTDYVTVDREGCSNCPTEITFPPMTFSTLMGDNSPIKMMFERSASLAATDGLQTTRVSANDDRGSCVGTHTNISTAAFRALSGERRRGVCNYLVGFFQSLTNQQRYALQGRAAYTTSVAQVRGGQGDGALRIEFKMFHTTTNLEQFNNYLLVSQRLAELIDGLAANSQRAVALTRNATECFAFLLQDVDRRSVIADNNPQYTNTIVHEANAAASASMSTFPASPVLQAA